MVRRRGNFFFRLFGEFRAVADLATHRYVDAVLDNIEGVEGVTSGIGGGTATGASSVLLRLGSSSRLLMARWVLLFQFPWFLPLPPCPPFPWLLLGLRLGRRRARQIGVGLQ